MEPLGPHMIPIEPKVSKKRRDPALLCDFSLRDKWSGLFSRLILAIAGSGPIWSAKSAVHDNLARSGEHRPHRAVYTIERKRLI
jgi:hypothetical protein